MVFHLPIGDPELEITALTACAQTAVGKTRPAAPVVVAKAAIAVSDTVATIARIEQKSFIFSSAPLN
jgi:hypothetical protein